LFNQSFTIPHAGAGDFYYNQLVAMYDTLSNAVTATKPAPNSTGQGLRLSTTDLTMTVSFVWQAMIGATNYQLQVADDVNFTSKRVDQQTTAQILDIGTIPPNQTLYWRARVIAPIPSPWSATRSFTSSTTELLSPLVDLTTPVSGATSVSLRPSLAWTRVIGAVGYDWEVAKDPAFTVPVERSGGTPSTITAAILSHDLEYNTTYYWRVRAQTVVKPPTYTDFTVGVFTTMAEPAAPAPPAVITVPAPPQIVQVPAPAAIPAYLLWVVVAIGALLVIAVVVLIVRTRRAG
jgi:hypothetical protein